MMSISSWLKNFEQKVPLAAISLILGIVFFAIGVYISSHEKKPYISYEIIKQANVLDVRKPLRDLTISFKGEDIQAKNLNLCIYSIRIENVGQADILQSHYDSNTSWGFKVEQGKIIEVRLVSCNSDYINSNINPVLLNDDSVEFRKIIFERGKFFIIEILIIHSKDKAPVITTFGKIAGIDALGIKPLLVKNKKGFFYEVFRGKILIQLGKLIVYFIFGLAILILVIFGMDRYHSWKELKNKMVRKKHILSLFGDIDEKRYPGKKIATDIYINQGIDGVKEINTLLDKEKDKLKLKIEQHYIEIKIRELENRKRHPSWEPLFYSFNLIADLVDNKILSLDDRGTIMVDPLFKQSIEQILFRELEIKKIKKK